MEKILRAIEHEDLLALHAWRNNNSLTNSTHGFRFPVSRERERQWINENIDRAGTDNATFAISNPQSKEIVGVAMLREIDPIHRNAKLGIFIGDQKMRGKGIGSRALLQILSFGFDDLNLEKIFLQVNKSNRAAINLYEKVGFVTEGVLRRHYYCNGNWEDLILMSIFRTNSSAS